MVNSPKSDGSHDSGAGTGKTHARKDRECQYCEQRFTSSSLGRHLDQFLFRKKPDGLHNVEEIRRLRGSITRRTAKGSGNAKQDREGSQCTPQTTSPVNDNSPVGEIPVDINATPAEGLRYKLNAPNWQSTGVINDLPASNTLSSALENVTPITGKRKSSSIETAAAKDILGLRSDLGNEKDTVRALELALREVLDNIQAARAKTTPARSPFPIDIQSHTFPSLVLHLLPPAPTLLTTSIPFAAPDSFPISSTPDHTHLVLLRSKITSLTTNWKSNLLNSPLPSNQPDINSYASYVSSMTLTHSATALQHLDLAYKHYVSQPKQQQQEIWQIELARAFALEQRKRKEAEDKVEAVMTEARQLSGQVECLSRCQWPREMALFPPERRPIRANLISELRTDAVRQAKRRKFHPSNGSAGEAVGDTEDEEDDEDDSRWDFDTLVSRWKKIVSEDAVRKRGLNVPSPNTLISSGTAGAGGNTVATTSNTTRTSKAPTSWTTTSLIPSSTTREDRQIPPTFEPWNTKPPFIEDHVRMIGIRVTKAEEEEEEEEQQQQQQQQQAPSSHRNSNHHDLVMDPPPPPPPQTMHH